MLVDFVNNIARKFGYRIKVEKTSSPVDIFGNAEFVALYDECKEFTMTSLERMFGLYQAMKYIIENGLEGDFVECGVWKGGSSKMMALMLMKYGMSNRQLYLYDTFEGMSEPTENDKTARGVAAETLMQTESKADEKSVWCYSPIDAVQATLTATGFPLANLHFIKGKVEDTLPVNIPGKLAMLRLDTDWYESTKLEMELLYPLLNDKGVLIIDDFGHWEGAKKAVTEYFESINHKPLLQRLDYTGRLMIK